MNNNRFYYNRILYSN